jgi:hypothetical protein
VIAVGAEKLDVFVPQLLPVTIKIAFAFGTGYPEDLCHDCPLQNKIRNSNIEIRNKREAKILNWENPKRRPNVICFEFSMFSVI